MVLSLPTSLFDEADENNDNLLSTQEFSKHRVDLLEKVQQTIILSTKNDPLILKGVMLKLDAPHDTPDVPAANLVVLGKFMSPQEKSPLYFETDFPDYANSNHLLKITASKKSDTLKQVFNISPTSAIAQLEFY